MAKEYGEKALNLARGRRVQSITGMERGSDEIRISFVDGSGLRLYHEQDCCEYVAIEDVTGDATDLVGRVLEMCEVVTSYDVDPPDDTQGSHTWTFYKFGTVNGYVTVRWLGTSNGYYCEEVDVEFRDQGGS